MRFICLFLILFCNHFLLLAQIPNGKLYVLNEGAFGEQGSVGYINYPCGEYVHIDSVAAYGSSVLVANEMLYVVDGNGDILCYKTSTHTLAHKIPNAKARQLKVYQNYLLSTTNKPPYFRAYDINANYNLAYSIGTDLIHNETEGIAIHEQFAYVAVNGLNGYGANQVTDSTVAIIDLNAKAWVGNIYVALNPVELAVANDGNLYIQSLDYAPGSTGLTLTCYNTSFNMIEYAMATGVGSYGGFSAVGNEIYFIYSDLATFQTYGIGRITLTEGNFNIEPNAIPGNYYGLLATPGIEPLIFASQTDFFSFGNVGYIKNNQYTQPVATIIAPRALAYVKEPMLLPAFVDTLVVCPQAPYYNTPASYTLILDEVYPAQVWDNGETGFSRIVNNTGHYWVDATMPNGCVFRDSVYVLFESLNSYGIKAFDSQGQIAQMEADTAVVFMSPTPNPTISLNFVSSLTQEEINTFVWTLEPDALEEEIFDIINPTVSFESDGLKTVYFDITTKSGCYYSFTQYVRIRFVTERNALHQATFNIYPNPAQANSTLTLKTLDNIIIQKARLLTVQGSVAIENLELANGKIKVPHVATGLYYLELQSPQGTMRTKLIIE